MTVYRLFMYCFVSLLVSGVFAQEKPEKGHENTNKFRQMYREFATPNRYRTAAGAPGSAYYQQRADYKMDIELDDRDKRLYGEETITYTNNSPDALEYLWVQLDQNIRSEDSPALLRDPEHIPPVQKEEEFVANHMKAPFDGGFRIEHVKDTGGKALPYTINFTMMRIDIPEPLLPGEKMSFSIKWWYNINDHTIDGARSGYEYFEKDGNRAYVIAQFFPRMAVYDDVEGWQNYQFWGDGEYALPFGNYEVNITVPSDHVMDATGTLQNRKDVYSKAMIQRYEKAAKSFDRPVVIATQEEAEVREKGFSDKKSTWKFKAENVRDFAFATSRKFILDAMAVAIGGKTVMAQSLYPREGNPLWEAYSTRVVAHTLKSYSGYTFEYPYPKAVSVHAKDQGMEYPMICWNHGRPEADGTYSDRVKYGMISVIIHEVGHNFFPMIVNSDERQWGWMDEGLNSFLQFLTEQAFEDNYPSRRGNPSGIVDYMKGDQDFIAPIMSNPENVYQLGNNAYGKVATGLNMLRETVMGHELFDYAFSTYARRWMFKHPTPEDFFRTMEDASGVELDWFWRGWFYTTDWVDMGIKDVKKFNISSEVPEKVRETMKADNITGMPRYFYELTFEKPGGMPMPLIVEYSYADGSRETVKYPVELWRRNDKEVTRIIASEKELTGIAIDPKQETADTDLTNNYWPRREAR
ncbi:M1 family metallopeptidase [Sinomicrobium soli]|uniref:M1 family metallopeptidase n=1 Tax=Sinomicrobium sp. N-1-3-6 TaxID=2219864 RepID=UPI000DCB7BCB|nr:M1 family metallopeptidase [Sinomicrobium sp. N-1-3-6]RAV28617.1 M1 family peptidase [Sinomicrobium sp. N-1-3-6]